MTDPLQELLASAIAALRADRIEEATEAFAAAHANSPRHGGVIRSLATLLNRQRQFARSLPVCRAGLALAPGDPVLTDLHLEALGHLPESGDALPQARQWVNSKTGGAQALFRLGSILLLRHQPAEALALLQEAAEEAPSRPDFLSAQAEAAFRTGDHAMARSCLARAVALEPGNRSLLLARATILLSLGDWRDGLQDYEARLWPGGDQPITRHLPPGLARWQDQPVAGRHLLICAEQGIGDQIRFMAALPVLTGLGARLTVEATARLVHLLRRAWPDLLFHPAQESREGPVHIFRYDWLQNSDMPDYYVEGGSLALRLLERGIAPGMPAPGRKT